MSPASGETPAAGGPEDIDPTILEVLPDDAPPGHDAHSKVKWNTGKWPHAFFVISDKKRLQATQAACDSKAAAMHLCRAMFLRHEGGESAEEVISFRQDIYSKIKLVVKGPEDEKKSKKARKSVNGDAVVAEVPLDPTTRVGADGNVLEDAPVGHDALKKNTVKYDTCNQLYWLKVPAGPDKDKKLTIKFSKVGGNHDETKRILRLCYVMLFEGEHTVQVVKEHMNKLVDDAASTGYNINPGDQVEDPAAAGVKDKDRGTPTRGTPGKESEAPPTAKRKLASELASESVDMQAVELTPEAQSVALKSRNKNGVAELYWCSFTTVDGKEIRCTANVAKCGSDEEAQRISRLCYAKMQGGATEKEMEAYRKILYNQSGAPAAKKPKKDAKDKKDPKEDKKAKKKKDKQKDKGAGEGGSIAAQIEQLKTSGRLVGAITIEGRDAGARNATINGAYAALKGGFEGKLAYKKADNERVLFYSSRKGRWKIHSSLDDAQGGFAYAKGPGDAAPGPSLRWSVYDGKEKGYTEDSGVKCKPIEGKPGEAEESKPVENKSAEGAEQQAADSTAEPSNQGGAESSASDSDSADSDDEKEKSSAASGSSSGSSSDESADEAPGPSPGDASPKPPVTPSSTAANAAALRNAAIKLALDMQGKRTRVCAKMLVRAKIRCTCHFAYEKDCPNKK